MNNNHKIIHGDCFIELENLIKQNIKVDLIIADLPYGMTNNSWDNKINLYKLWPLINKIKKSESTPIILFGDFPFSIELIQSNQKHYRYTWYWNKIIKTGFLDCSWKPLKVIEHIHVFIEKPFQNVKSNQEWKKFDKISQYFPQMEKGNNNHSTGTKLASNAGTTYNKFKSRNEIKITNSHITTFYRSGMSRIEKTSDMKYPINLLEFQKEKPNKYSKNYHPTAKPIKLLEYLIKTYSQENDIILDFVAGGGNLLQACINTNRKSINIEIEEKYINMIKEKLNNDKKEK